MRLGISLGWPRHQMAERSAAGLLEEEELGLELECENRMRPEVEEDLDSLSDEGGDRQRGEEKESKKGEVWRKMLYMITNHPGPNSIHSPVKVNYQK